MKTQNNMTKNRKISNGVKSRKFYIWLISLAAVLAVYLLYSWLSETPQIKIDTAAETVADSNFGDFDSEIGMVGDVGVGTVKVAKFITLNKDKSIDREFGFEKLLHEIGDEWEIEKPYMNVFRRGFKCHLTADKGKVQIEDAFGRPSPKDATLTGNVVIHILPENSSDIKESFIYLDDIVFISEKSQFSTAGPVKFVSENAQMLGTGMELVYNDELNRLEFLRIVHLETLRLKTSEAALFSSGQTRQTPVGRSVGTSGRAQTEPHAEPVASDIPQKAKTSPTVSQKVVEQTTGENYRCIFSKNVVIDGPEQLIFADQVSINDIFFSSAPSEKSGKADTGGADSVKSQDVTEETVGTDRIETHDVNAAKQAQPYKSPQDSADIIVTCDNGILVTPMDSPLRPDAVVIGAKAAGGFTDANGRPTFVAQRIDYTESTGDTIASGPSELTFYADDVIGNETKQTAVPVKVTAREKVTFLPASNQVVFEGDCLCTMLREDPNVQQKYTLSAPKLTVNLSRDKSGSDTNIEHLTASGGPVQLDTSKWAAEVLLGFTKLKCRRFDYDSGRQMFLATGPDGIIAADNSKIAEPEKEVGRFSLQRPSYAVVRDFETLKYSLEANRIIADAGRGQILIDYFPITKGQHAEQVSATAGLIEALLYEAAPGRTELSTLRATGGVTYQEQGKKKKWGKSKDIQFVGSEMFYDADKSLITAWGDELQPCLLNGALVDAIKYDLKTGKIKTKITGPGMLQMRR
jgi:hypothetical protein